MNVLSVFSVIGPSTAPPPVTGIVKNARPFMKGECGIANDVQWCTLHTTPRNVLQAEKLHEYGRDKKWAHFIFGHLLLLGIY